MTDTTQPDHAPATERVRLVRAILATLDDDATRRDVATTVLNLGRAIGRAARYSTAMQLVLRGQRQTCAHVRCVVAAWDLDAMPALAEAARACSARVGAARPQPIQLYAIVAAYWQASPYHLWCAIEEERPEAAGLGAAIDAEVEELEGILRGVGGDPEPETYHLELARAREEQDEILLREFSGWEA